MKIMVVMLSLILAGSMPGCAGLTDEQQRMLSGGAMGAAGGALLGAVAGGSAMIGAAVGGAAGVAAGYAINEHQKAKTSKAKPGKKNDKTKDKAVSSEKPD
jgi:hypothetical protein